MTSSYASGKESTTFIEMDKVKDVIINEAIYMQKVIYYLCILLKDPGKPHEISQVVPVFQSAKPRLDCLIEVYRSCQEILAHQKATSTSPWISAFIYQCCLYGRGLLDHSGWFIFCTVKITRWTQSWESKWMSDLRAIEEVAGTWLSVVDIKFPL